MIRDSNMGPAEVHARHKAEIEEGQRLRGWITKSYAQIEYMLGDLIVRSCQFTDYQSLPKTMPHDATKRIKRVRRLLELEGPLSPYRREILDVLDEFESKHETRNLLAHGFCTYLVTPDGDSGLEFQKWHRQPNRHDARLVRCFRLKDLEREEKSFSSAAQNALTVFVGIHGDFGWIG